MNNFVYIFQLQFWRTKLSDLYNFKEKKVIHLPSSAKNMWNDQSMTSFLSVLFLKVAFGLLIAVTLDAINPGPESAHVS
jgi:hypothetical protein